MKSEVNFDALMTKFEYLDVQKLRAIMVPEQALVEGKGGTSSRNVAATFGDVFQESQAVLMEEIDDHINRYMIPQLLEANFGPGGAPCTKVTTGFDPQDLDTMRSIIESVANKTGIDALPVDERELLTRLGVPTMSAREFQKRQEEVAAQAEQQHARSMEAKAGQAGIRTDGSYYNDRDRVVLSGSRPYVVERVDELPLDDSPPAVYDSETRTLFVRKDADVDSVKRFIIGLAEKKDDEQLPTIPDTDVIKEMFQAIDLRLSEANERPINVEVNMPDTPKKTTKIRTDIEYDENDNIVGKIEYEIEGED
jgi:hypothetical protein